MIKKGLDTGGVQIKPTVNIVIFRLDIGTNESFRKAMSMSVTFPDFIFIVEMPVAK